MFRIQYILGLILFLSLAAGPGCDTSGTNSNDAPVEPEAAADHVLVSGVPFVEGYQQGYGRARQQGKPMLVFFAAEGCDYCSQMVDETFTDRSVVAWSDRFVCILVDADAEPDVCRQFRVRGYPTIQFLSAHGVPLNRVVGRRGADQVVLQMQAALGAMAVRPAPTTLQ